MKIWRFFPIAILFVSCQMDLTGFVKFPEKLSDQRFNGKFSRGISGYVYGDGSLTYKFDGTTYAVLKRSQTYKSGYQLSYLDYEIEVSNGKYRERIWKNDSSGSWDAWEDYQFDDDGDLRIGSLEYKKQ